MRVMICVAFHYDERKIKFLKKVIKNFSEDYKCEVSIFIDSNSNKIHELDFLAKNKKVSLILHKSLKHPFSLTWMHRENIYQNRNKYDYYMYSEDDLIISWSTFSKYTESLKKVYPNYIPTLCRYEKTFIGERYAIDFPRKIKVEKIIELHGESYIINPHPYSGCWILDNNSLINNLSEDFFQPKYLKNESGLDGLELDFYDRLRLEPHVKGSLHRELAGSFPIWQLNKTNIIKLNKNKQGPCNETLIHHLGNKYIKKRNTSFGKIKIKTVLKG